MLFLMLSQQTKVPAYPGCPGKEAVKWLLLLLFSQQCQSTEIIGIGWNLYQNFEIEFATEL